MTPDELAAIRKRDRRRGRFDATSQAILTRTEQDRRALLAYVEELEVRLRVIKDLSERALAYLDDALFNPDSAAPSIGAAGVTLREIIEPRDVQP